MGAEWHEVGALLERADRLRRLAGRVDGSALRDLAPLAGYDTWVGASADAFRASLRRAGALLDDAAGDLRLRAARLERDADEVAAQCRAAELLGR